MRKNKKAQSILEFSLVGVVIIASIVSVPLYIKHGLVERISKRGRDAADDKQIDKTSIALLVTATVDARESGNSSK